MTRAERPGPAPDRPARHTEAGPEQLRGDDLRKLVWHILAGAGHPVGRRELFRTVRDELDPRQYARPGDRRVRECMRLELLAGTVDLTFRDHARMTPVGLRELETADPGYHGKVAAAVHDLAAAAADLPDQVDRPRDRHPGVTAGPFERGMAVTWSAPSGLMRYDGTDLLSAEKALLPSDHRRYGTLHLVTRRLELHLNTDGHAEELLAFNYPHGDEDVGRRTYTGSPTPDMHTEIRRDRVPLGVLRQLTAELAGRA